MKRSVPRLAFTRSEAAESLGMSLTSFETYVQPHVRIVRRGKLRLVAVEELRRWVHENQEATIDRRRGAA